MALLGNLFFSMFLCVCVIFNRLLLEILVDSRESLTPEYAFYVFTSALLIGCILVEGPLLYYACRFNVFMA